MSIDITRRVVAEFFWHRSGLCSPGCGAAVLAAGYPSDASALSASLRLWPDVLTYGLRPCGHRRAAISIQHHYFGLWVTRRICAPAMHTLIRRKKPFCPVVGAIAGGAAAVLWLIASSQRAGSLSLCR